MVEVSLCCSSLSEACWLATPSKPLVPPQGSALLLTTSGGLVSLATSQVAMPGREASCRSPQKPQQQPYTIEQNAMAHGELREAAYCHKRMPTFKASKCNMDIISLGVLSEPARCLASSFAIDLDVCLYDMTSACPFPKSVS
eukprot:6489253-Amphidinium_carterae.2